MEFLIWVWVAAACLSVAIELLSMQMIAVWFTFSSLATIVLWACGVVWWVQVLVFFGLALILLLALRKFSLKYLLKNDNHPTNIDSLVGTKHKLLSAISEDQPGEVKINGIVWTATSENGKSIEKDRFVEILKVSGNKLFVKKLQQEETEQKTKKGGVK